MILKWRYFKSGTPKHAEHLVKYIATREGVEKCDESWKYEEPTREQQRLIKNLLDDFPSAKDCFEYQDYVQAPTKASASAFISRAIDDHLDVIAQKDNYVQYIAKRPRVEKEGTHGLFTQDDKVVNLSDVAKTVAEHEGDVFTFIVSLRREDAERLGYDHAALWKNTLRDQAPAIAKAMNIPLTDLRWYAAFHNEGSHPHVHVVAYSDGVKPYMTQQRMMDLKSSLARMIFRSVLHEIYTQQTVARDALRHSARERIEAIVKEINNGRFENENIVRLLRQLSKELDGYTGRRVYGYLPRSAKNIINAIVGEMEKDPRIAEMYDLWYQQKENIIGVYQQTMPPRVPLSQNKEFRSVRNAILDEAFHLSEPTARTAPLDLFGTHDKRDDTEEELDVETPSFSSRSSSANKDDHGERDKKRSSSNKRYTSDTMLMLSAARLFGRLSQIIQDKACRNDTHGRMTDKKLRQKINQKKQDQGQKIGG